MATQNPEPQFLCEAVKSVLNQKYRDFEFIIIDDGSDIPVGLGGMMKANGLTDNDAKISVYRINHSGLGAALNYGIARAKGEYIARLDDDDLMLPKRLERQVEYLDSHHEVSCVGTWFFDRVGDKYRQHRKYPINHDAIVHDLICLRWGLAHTTVMFRKLAFEQIGGYRIAGGGQDLDLFLQLGTVGLLANVAEYLTVYTMSATGLGTVNPKKNEAYLFALADILKSNSYPHYHEATKNSINRLRKTVSKSRWKTKFMRTLMVLRVKMFGVKGNMYTCAKRMDRKEM